MRLLVTGAAGMLGTDVVTAASAAGHDVTAVDVADADLTVPAQVDGLVADAQPDAILNCAAWTDVDAAEAHETRALAINGTAVEHLATAARRSGARLLQISTDYVFRGDAVGTPYSEDAAPDPVNAYGRTKLAGERAALGAGGQVVRTAWLYGANGPSFVATMRRLEQERETVQVVTDQVGQPTCTRDLAARLVELVGNSQAGPGIYHGTATGQTSWHGLAQAIFRLLGADPQRVLPTTSEAFPRPAPRPAWSVLGHDRWAAAGMEPLRDWHEALSEVLPTISAR
ncbi:MAG: dTDP-4-dehydrorhamnose reductase [Frankiales bacterium]|jgi:dTDP-4-dehydrorhamnose reductase|nr:dTDP-4-dehydrorhamnose reductase [Frankiales bacterium]